MSQILLNVLCLVLANEFSIINCGRILFVPGHNGASHTKSMYPAAEALARIGHEVVMLQLILDPKQECRNKAGVIDRVIHTAKKMSPSEDSSTILSSLIWTKGSTTPIGIIFPWYATTDVCVQILANDSTRNAFYETIDEDWDAVVVDDFFAPCGSTAINRRLADRGVAVVDFSTTVLLPTSLEPRGVVVPTSLVSSFREPVYENRKFSYRLWVTLDNVQYNIVVRFLDFLIPFWGRGHGLHDVTTDVLGRKSLFATTAVATGLDFAQPQTLDIGDLDIACPTDTSLPEKFEKFINDPNSRGTILFALGHYTDWNYAPPGAADAFASAFGRLSEYRIVWQYVSKSIKPQNLSSNILIESWIPQAAILNHPKTKLFVSHMGLKSMRESICARVPSVALPMFAEQYRNTALSRYRGFAAFLDKTDLSDEIVYRTIKNVLDDDRYAANVRRLQDQLSDRLLEASDVFTFRLEFFIRHNDQSILDRYIRTKWKKMPFLTQWWQADVILPLMAFLLVLLSHLV